MDSCLTCDDTLNRKLVGSLCLCKEGYAEDGGTGLCVPCHYSCSTCQPTDSSKCTSCNPESYRVLNGDSCSCLEGFYDDTTN